MVMVDTEATVVMDSMVDTVNTKDTAAFMVTQTVTTVKVTSATTTDTEILVPA